MIFHVLITDINMLIRDKSKLKENQKRCLLKKQKKKQTFFSYVTSEVHL